MLGENIKRLMKENGYTQKQLAMRAQCTESAISKYVNNEREPNIRILKNLSIALGVTVDELISERCCKDCARYDEECKEFVSPFETFPEVGGCEAFKSAADVAPRAEVAREIFAEISDIIQRNTQHDIRNGFICVSGYNCKQIVRLIYELKEKYTEGTPDGKRTDR